MQSFKGSILSFFKYSNHKLDILLLNGPSKCLSPSPLEDETLQTEGLAYLPAESLPLFRLQEAAVHLVSPGDHSGHGVLVTGRDDGEEGEGGQG